MLLSVSAVLFVGSAAAKVPPRVEWRLKEKELPMKLNFWQWIGVLLLVVAVIVWFFWDRPRRERKRAAETSTLLVEPGQNLISQPVVLRT